MKSLKAQQENMSTNALVLLSGGIDSATCARYLQDRGFDVSCVCINYGQLAAQPEQRAATAIAKELGMQLSAISISAQREFGAGEILGRNALLVLAALTMCEVKSGVIGLGIHAGTPYYDCSPAFLTSIDRLIAEYSDGRVRVIAPFLLWNKKDVFDYYSHTGFPSDIAYSCEAGQVPPCGICASCRDRRILGCFH
jgi:7-cyano-7-deazaguanine synthase